MATTEMTMDNYRETIEGNRIVLVELFAPWCGHCRGFTPVFEKVSDKHADVKFCLVNTEQERELTNLHNVRGVPTVVGYRDGVEVFRQSGVMSEDELERVVADVREREAEKPSEDDG